MIDIFINTIAHPAFTAILGFVAGHFWTLWRDKRKEFNDIAVPISIRLMSQLNLFKRGGYAEPFHFISVDDFNLLELHLPKRIITKYRKDLDHYKQSAESCGHWASGGFMIDSLADYIKATETMLSYAKKK